MRRPVRPLFWALAQLGSRVRHDPPASLDLTTAALPVVQTITIPTRHGDVRTLVQRPTGTRTPGPVVVHLHGGGFVNRYPEQDRYLARFLAAEAGVTVLLVDYSTAPKVRFPVAEEQVLDVVQWVRRPAPDQDWDGERLVLSGVSAGAKLAINVCQQLRALGAVPPLAVALIVPVTDVVRTDRTSRIAKPAISPFVQRFVGWSYFPDVERRREALASPRYDATLAEAMPPTLVLTAELDTLATEGAELVQVLDDAGIEVTHHEFPGVDHDFPASEPVGTVRTMLTELATFVRVHVSAST